MRTLEWMISQFPSNSKILWYMTNTMVREHNSQYICIDKLGHSVFFGYYFRLNLILVVTNYE